MNSYHYTQLKDFISIDPNTYEEVVCWNEFEVWLIAMQDEIDSLVENKT